MSDHVPRKKKSANSLISLGLTDWVRGKAFNFGFHDARGEFVGEIRLHNILCNSVTARMREIGYDELDVREELLRLIEQEDLIRDMLHEESRRRVHRVGPKNKLPAPSELPFVWKWIQSTSMKVGFWDRTANGVQEGEFVGQIRLYNRLLDRLPDLQRYSHGGGPSYNQQSITKTLLVMIDNGFIEELKTEGEWRRCQKYEDEGFDQEFGGMLSRSQSPTEAFPAPQEMRTSNFFVGEELGPLPEFGNRSGHVQKKGTSSKKRTSGKKGASGRHQRRPPQDPTESYTSDTPIAPLDTSSALDASNCHTESITGAEVAADEAIIIPDFKPLPAIEIPADIQRSVLRTLQHNLEGAFFYYAQSHYPQLLTRNNWTCAQSAPLNIWTAEFHKACASTQLALGPGNMESVTMIFNELEDLYETCINRIPVTANRLAEFTSSAAYAMKYLKDSYRAEKVNEISLALVTACSDCITRQFNRVANELADDLDKIALERKKLDKAEKRIKKKLGDEMQELVDALEEGLVKEIGDLGILNRIR